MLRETKIAIRLKSITNVKELLIYIYMYIYYVCPTHSLVREISDITPAFDIYRLQIRQKKKKKTKTAASPTFF